MKKEKFASSLEKFHYIFHYFQLKAPIFRSVPFCKRIFPHLCVLEDLLGDGLDVVELLHHVIVDQLLVDVAALLGLAPAHLA